MIYIKLDRDMTLSVTAREPLYRGDNMSRKIIFLTPLAVGEVDMMAAAVYLSYIRADGTADIALLNRMEEKYNDEYFQYTLPITSTLTRYPGDVCMWLQIYSGSPRDPVIAKSSECTLQIQASTNMDEYISDRNLSLIYQMQRTMEEKIEKAEESLNDRIDETNEAMAEGFAGKADGVTFNEEDGTLQLMSGDNPVGDAIAIKMKDSAVSITAANINDAGELVVTFSDGTTKSIGVVVGKDGSVYVPHIDAHKVLTFTLEDEPSEPPEPFDLDPSDDWSDLGDGDEPDEGIKTDYVWEGIG